tara:strand:+ start:743 stop:1831 length:1089 start_codon:yes stop_codon:yes gene_type:complete
MFPRSYSEARNRFLDLCQKRYIEVKTLAHADYGSSIAGLETDLVVLEGSSPKSTILVVSGTHGPESIVGSACQMDFIHSLGSRKMPSDLRIVILHVLNAYGAANCSRWTEEIVDLNRNFVDFSGSVEELNQKNPRYHEVHAILDGVSTRADAVEFVSAGKSELDISFGLKEAMRVLFQGQYSMPAGVSYGGSLATVSRRLFEDVVRTYCADLSSLAVIDIHSGLGRFGEGLLLSLTSSPEQKQRLQDSYADQVVLVNDESFGLPYKVTGDLSCEGVQRIAPDCLLSSIALEYGTFDEEALLEAVLTDYYLRNVAEDADSGCNLEAKERIMDFFNPRSVEWQESVLSRWNWVLDRTYRSLGAF